MSTSKYSSMPQGCVLEDGVLKTHRVIDLKPKADQPSIGTTEIDTTGSPQKFQGTKTTTLDGKKPEITHFSSGDMGDNGFGAASISGNDMTNCAKKLEQEAQKAAQRSRFKGHTLGR